MCQIIEKQEITQLDIGKEVIYTPPHANGNINHPDSERGTIKSWNEKFVFVDYGYNTKATPARLLKWN